MHLANSKSTFFDFRTACSNWGHFFFEKQGHLQHTVTNFGRRWATKKTKRQLTTEPKSDDWTTFFDLSNGLLYGKLFIKLTSELLFWVKSQALLLCLEQCRRFARLIIYSSYYCYFLCAHLLVCTLLILMSFATAIVNLAFILNYGRHLTAQKKSSWDQKVLAV